MAGCIDVSDQSYTYGPWSVQAKKSHILASRCNTPLLCASKRVEDLCSFCLYEVDLDLPQIPEMTFPNNLLSLKHKKGFSIVFNALEALKMVDSRNDPLKVAIAEAWQESRMENSEIRDVVKPFDWTYSMHFKGKILGNEDLVKITPTEERINFEKLKEKSKILFYADIVLFEDELADNGSAQLSVKIRIMPENFFILMRYFLRVDHLLVRIIDTRIYHEVEKNYLLREHVTKEDKNTAPRVTLLRPQDLWDSLPTVQSEYEKIEF